MDAPRIEYATTADGASIAYYAIGEGTPLLIAPGVSFSDAAAMWKLEAPDRFTDAGCRVVRFDWRCTGSSDRTPVTFSLDTMVADIDGVARTAVPRQRFALLSYATASYAAIAYAARYPRRLLHLFLRAPSADGKADYESNDIFKGLESLREMGDERWHTYLRAESAVADPASAHQPADEIAAIRRRAITPEATRAWLEWLPTVNVSALLPRLKVPTVVFINETSLAPVALQHSVAARIPNAKSVVTRAGPVSWILTPPELDALRDHLGLARAHSSTEPERASDRSGAGGSVLRSILFTDIEGHTDMLQRLGDAAGRTVLREHERVTREVLRTYDGAEIKSMGDGFMASFTSATRAIGCAIALQAAFAKRNQLAAEPIRVRVGINAGEPIEEDDDLFGSAVVVASRIMAQGNGGDILVAGVVRSLVAGKGFSFADRGTVALKGIREPVPIYEVRWQDAP